MSKLLLRVSLQDTEIGCEFCTVVLLIILIFEYFSTTDSSIDSNKIYRNHGAAVAPQKNLVLLMLSIIWINFNQSQVRLSRVFVLSPKK